MGGLGLLELFGHGGHYLFWALTVLATCCLGGGLNYGDVLTLLGVSVGEPGYMLQKLEICRDSIASGV